MNNWYRTDLAWIHDVGFSDYALKSAPGILEIFQQHHIQDGLVVDLGCGSGLWAQELVQSGYQVLGIDISEAMIAIAQQWLYNATEISTALKQVGFRVQTIASYGQYVLPTAHVAFVAQKQTEGLP